MTLKIEAGKYYRTRDGRKVGPMLEWTGDSNYPFEVDNAPDVTDLSKSLWTREGVSDEGTQADIIAEWRDELPAHIITHESREYDLTALGTPFGLLQEKAPPVADALKAWPHGFEIYGCDETGRRGAWVNAPCSIWDWHVVRAKPAPVEERIICYRGIAGVGGKYGTCVLGPDGKPDWTTWKPET